MEVNWRHFLNRTKLRDGAVFLLVTLLITALLHFTVYQFMAMDFKRIVISVLVIGQFYFAAFIRLPIPAKGLRRFLLIVIFTFNFFIFRELIRAFTPPAVSRIFDLESVIVIVFLLSLFSRSIRMYYHLREQLVTLNYWTQKKILFEKPAKLTVNLGRDGELQIHPNELVYVRTKAAGDHTKIFGVKQRQPSGINPRLAEHETTTYKNFEQVLQLLKRFPQFKRVHGGTVINTIYPFRAKDGILSIEGRRFKVSRKEIIQA